MIMSALCALRLTPDTHDRRGVLHPSMVFQWYGQAMGGTYQVVMGDRGRLVIPAELRERLSLELGTLLVLIASDRGVLLATREQLKNLVRAELAGTDLVAELIAERRRLSAAEDVA